MMSSQHKVAVKYLSDDTLQTLAKISKGIVAEEAAKTPMGSRIHDSLNAFLKLVSVYSMAADAAFLNARQKFVE